MNGKQEKEIHSSCQSQTKYNLVTDNPKKREKRKTYAEALKEDFRNGTKQTRKGVVRDKERNTGIRDNVSYVNKVMDCNEEDSREFGKPKPIFFGYLQHLIQTYQHLVISVLELHAHLQICHWIHTMKRF